jgi:hypothetical protein
MATKPFDQFNKRLFQELLSPLGTVIPDLAILGEERWIDIFFAPNPGAEPSFEELGILAQMIDRPALLEPCRDALSHQDVESCLIKLFSLRGELQREYPLLTVTKLPHLWLLAAEVSDRLLNEFTDNQPSPTLGEGFYPMRPGLRATIVTIAELPVTPDTLWIRLMGKGRTQENAIEELILLRETDPKRANVLNLVVSWRINIGITNQVENEEQRILMALSQAYVEWEKQTRRQGLERGLEQGLERERRSVIVSLMGVRYGRLDEQLEAIVPKLMGLSSDEYTALLIGRSREELLREFGPE